MTKVVGCISCGYRTEVKAEMDNFIANGCQCQKECCKHDYESGCVCCIGECKNCGAN